MTMKRVEIAVGKLVRSRMQAVIEENLATGRDEWTGKKDGERCVGATFRRASAGELRLLLAEKLVEEANEYLQAVKLGMGLVSGDGNKGEVRGGEEVAELADVIEVLRGISVRMNDMDRGLLEVVGERKREERGDFGDGLVMESLTVEREGKYFVDGPK